MSDHSVDLSFSNGFWVLFNDDARILDLAREQARVTRRWMVVLVHNGLNSRLRTKFANSAKTDDLYNIRFFSPDEVERIVRASGIAFRSISLEKFGGACDLLYRSRLKGIPNIASGLAPNIVPRLYNRQQWSGTERVACVVELA